MEKRGNIFQRQQNNIGKTIGNNSFLETDNTNSGVYEGYIKKNKKAGFLTSNSLLKDIALLMESIFAR